MAQAKDKQPQSETPEKDNTKMANAIPASGDTNKVDPKSNPTVNEPINKGSNKTMNGAKRVDN